MQTMLSIFIGTLIGIVGISLLGGVVWLLLLRLVDHVGVEAGGSSGRQSLTGRTERTYTATISIPGRPAELVTSRYYSRGEAKTSLRSMYGKRNVSEIRVVEEASTSDDG